MLAGSTSRVSSTPTAEWPRSSSTPRRRPSPQPICSTTGSCPDEHGIKLQRILTDRGTEYCGKPENHAYQLYLAVEDIDHSRTKASHPQTNGICERFHRTMQDECYSLLFRKKLYRSVEELQVDVDEWIRRYNMERPHSERYCYGKMPWQTFLESKHIALSKYIAPGGDASDNGIDKMAVG